MCGASTAAGLAGALRAELRELTLSGPRARLAASAALAVGSAILAALLLRLDAPWWAGISAFTCTQASVPQSGAKGLLRIAGTAAGAVTGFVFAPWFVYDALATLLLLFTAGTLAIAGSLLSRHGYAWLLGGVTTVMVTLGSLDHPELALRVAVYRTAEIVLGVVAALLVAQAHAEPGDSGRADAPGWSSLFGRNWHVLGHAVRSGIVVAAVPVVWRVMEIPNLSQMAISVTAVMAVPQLSGDAAQDEAGLLQRGAQRIAGCGLGGGAGLLLLSLPMDSLVPWLLALMAGAWLGMLVQSGRHGVGVAAAQAVIAFIMTLVQGQGPPTSLAPALERLAGMLGALAMLLAATLFLGPAPLQKPRPARPGSGSQGGAPGLLARLRATLTGLPAR